MPTRVSLERAGVDTAAIAAKYTCYVCGDPVAGMAQRDTPRLQPAEIDGEIIPPAPAGTELGVRHRGCEPSEFAGETKKVMLAWRLDQMED